MEQQTGVVRFSTALTAFLEREATGERLGLPLTQEEEIAASEAASYLPRVGGGTDCTVSSRAASMLALKLGWLLAFEQARPTLVISSMGSEQGAGSILRQTQVVRRDRFRNGVMNALEYVRLLKLADHYSSVPLYLADSQVHECFTAVENWARWSHANGTPLIVYDQTCSDLRLAELVASMKLPIVSILSA